MSSDLDAADDDQNVQSGAQQHYEEKCSQEAVTGHLRWAQLVWHERVQCLFPSSSALPSTESSSIVIPWRTSRANESTPISTQFRQSDKRKQGLTHCFDETHIPCTQNSDCGHDLQNLRKTARSPSTVTEHRKDTQGAKPALLTSSQAKVHSQPRWVVAVPSGRGTSFVRNDVHNPSSIHRFQRRSQRQERRTTRHRPAATLPRV